MVDEATKNATAKSIVVAGDVFTDHHLYQGQRHAPAQDEKLNLLEVIEPGGSALLVSLLKRTCEKPDGLPRPVGAQPPVPWSVSHSPRHSEQHAYAYWSPFPKTSKEEDQKSGIEFWRVRLPLGYGESANSAGKPPATADTATPPALPRWDMLVLDDAGFRFRHQEKEWLLSQAADNDRGWIVLKMSRPIARGELWYELLKPQYSKRLVCVVSADELRQECVSISNGLSWERTVEEVLGALHGNPEVAPLTKCRHLIVRFASDGALWIDFANPSEPAARLVFDAAGIEGTWDDNHEGTVVGSSTVFTSALVHGLAQSKPGGVDLVAAIKSGLAAVRDLEQSGHGEKGKDSPSGFPTERIAAVISKAEGKFGEAKVPWPKRREGGSATALVQPETWMIVEDFHRFLVGDYKSPIVGLAREIVTFGEKKVLENYPFARFGDLVVIDRYEIELLRSIRRLMLGYRKNEKAEKPLSIGVFGPPGAGKSFGVKQLANEIFTSKAWLEFNLSQFSSASDLAGAFHQVRDKVLSGVTPVVFWDEFDSKDLDWLQYLLAPMQDGRFQHEQLSHWIGKCVFVFAGGTSTTFETFPPPTKAPPSRAWNAAVTHFKLKKGPDFHSRLDGYYDVAGPNPKAKPRTTWAPNQESEPDPADVCFPLRRALFIRSKLKCGNDQVDFDSDLLDALLLTPKFKHGARSLEKLIAELRASASNPARRSALLAVPLRTMHVDDEAFERALNRNTEFFTSPAIDELAVLIHQMWLDENADDPEKKAANEPFDELPLVWQDDNRAAARRIPGHLALVGLAVAHKDSKEPELEPHRVDDHLSLKDRLEYLAEAEHKGWMRQRFATGWTFGPRDEIKKVHPSLKAFAELSREDQQRDRNKILAIPALLGQVDYRVVRWRHQ